MATTLAQSPAELKVLLRHLDKALLEKALEVARQCYKTVLEAFDDALAERRSHGLRIEHRREVWHQTLLGPVAVSRRVYRDAKGRRRYLLEEFLGMSKRDHITPGVRDLVLELPTGMTYRRAAELLRKITAIELTHQTIHRLVQKTAAPYLEKETRQRQWFMETGELPDGEGRKVGRLMVEADGVMVSLQRQKARKVEVKLGIAYEGWEKVGRDRYRTVNKTIYADVSNGDDFWAGMTLRLWKKYDLASVKGPIVGGDGAGWVREGACYLNGHFQLDGYHLHRELITSLGKDNETRSKVWRAIRSGQVEAGLEALAEAMKQARGEQAEKLRHIYAYLQTNRPGLVDYRLGLGEEAVTLRRTGAIEGNVHKLIAQRMKNQGMSWSIKGIRSLLCIRFLALEGKLAGWLDGRTPSGPDIRLPKKAVRRIVSHLSVQGPDDWLQVGLPALRGPHASRPWVKVLRLLAEVQPL